MPSPQSTRPKFAVAVRGRRQFLPRVSDSGVPGGVGTPKGMLLKQFLHLLRRPRDNGLLAAHDDGALHQLRMLLQEAHHRISGGVVGGVEAQRLEVSVVADEFGRRFADKVDETRHRGRVNGGLEVLNDIELDVALAQDVQRAA